MFSRTNQQIISYYKRSVYKYGFVCSVSIHSSKINQETESPGD